MTKLPFIMKCLGWPKLKLLTATTFQLCLANSELLDNSNSFSFSSVLALGFALQPLFWHSALTTNWDIAKRMLLLPQLLLIRSPWK